MNHPDENRLVEYAERRLPAAEMAAIEAHLDACSDCRRLVASLAEALPPASAETEPEELARGATLGRYVVLERVGAGGMGVVYAAVDPALDRKVALKLLHPELAGDGSDGAARLLREAQALAKLSHDNVVPVYDVGTTGDRVFLAMGFVEGTTLKEWLGARPRDWREVRGVFLQAARGLSAAHAAGLVHRDFKPANVLVGADGRVRVTDFGLARGAAAEPSDDAAPAPTSPQDRLSTPLTRPGVLAGTPAYMAPEQFDGAPPDPRSDQFAFCVALHEALTGSRPFAGPAAGATVAWPAESAVPAWLRAVVARGLAPSSADRYPSIDALIADLARDPDLSRRRRRVAAAALALAGLSALAVDRYYASAGLTCGGAERKLEGVWDPKRKEETRAAFLATGKSFAGAAFDGVARALDPYAAEWIRMHRDACEATRVRGEQSEEALDLRMGCLERRRAQLAALSELFAAADAKMVQKAVDSAHALPAIERCADLAALRAPVPPPEDPAARLEVDEIRRGLARAAAVRSTDRTEEASTLAEDLSRRANAAGWPPVIAESTHLEARIADDQGGYERAERLLSDALLAAERGRHDELLAEIHTDLAWVAGYRRGRAEEGVRHAKLADAILERMGGGDPSLRALLEEHWGVLLWHQGKSEEALPRIRRSIDLRTAVAGSDHPRVAQALNNLGIVANDLGRFDEALEAHRRALEINERVLGGQHPAVGRSLTNLGTLHWAMGRAEESLACHRRALAILESALGPEHALVASALTNVGSVLQEQGRFAEALQLHRRAVAIKEKAYGPDHAQTASSLNNLAEALLELGRPQDALDSFHRARAIWEKTLGADHPRVAYALTGIGRCELALGRPAQALPPLERALLLREGKSSDRTDLADVRFALARAEVESGRDRARARTLALGALDDAAHAGERGAARKTRIEDWLARQKSW